MAGNYIPRPDGDFDAWQANFITYASANAAALDCSRATSGRMVPSSPERATSLACRAD